MGTLADFGKQQLRILRVHPGIHDQDAFIGNEYNRIGERIVVIEKETRTHFPKFSRFPLLGINRRSLQQT